MINPAKSKLKVIRITDPLMCVRCDNAYIADVITAESNRKKMFYCSRLDCDNWMTENNVQNDIDKAA